MGDLDKRGFHDRWADDSRGRRFDFVQSGRVHRSTVGADAKFPQTALHWKCRACGCVESVKAKHLIHDEVLVEDPTAQLDAHDCDLARARQVMED